MAIFYHRFTGISTEKTDIKDRRTMVHFIKVHFRSVCLFSNYYL